MSRRTHFLIGVLIGVLLLLMVGRLVEWSAVIDALGHAPPRDLLLGLVSVFAFVITKALRWSLLVRPLSHVVTRQLLPAVFAGAAGNSVIPHAGELVRAIVARRHITAGTSAILGTIAVERMLDFVSMLLIAVGVLLPFGVMSRSTEIATWIVALIGGAALAALVLVNFRSAPLLAWVERRLGSVRPRLRERLLREVRLGMEGLGSLRKPRLIAAVMVLSVGQWSLMAATIFFSLQAVGIAAPSNSVVSILLLTVAGLALPTAPGYVGTLQAAFVLGLSPFGVDAVSAVAAACVYNVLVVVPIWMVALPSLRGHARQIFGLH